MKQLKEFLNKIYKLDDTELEDFLARWKQTNYKKGELISWAGEVEKYYSQPGNQLLLSLFN